MILILMKNLYPFPASKYEFQHTTNTSYYAFQQQVIVDKVDSITSFFEQIPYNFTSENTFCDEFCENFVQITRLNTTQYHVYSAFMLALIDPMLASFSQKTTSFYGISVQVNQNIPFYAKFTDLLRDLVVQVVSSGKNSYTAIQIAGVNGYIYLEHSGAKQFVTGTGKQNCVDYNLPEFDEMVFLQQVESQIVSNFPSIFERIMTYTLLCDGDILPGDLIKFVRQNNNALYSQEYIMLSGDFIGNSSFQESNGDYFRGVEAFQVQSSCTANLDNIMASDFRMIQVERSGNENPISTIQDFEKALMIFPFRNEQTAVISSLDKNGLKSEVVKCDSVFDGKKTVRCDDLPPQASAAAISISLLIVVATIAAWVYGCLVSKKMSQKVIQQ